MSGQVNAKLYYLRPLNASESAEIHTLLSAIGPVNVKFIASLITLIMTFLGLLAASGSTSEFFQSTQGGVVGMLIFVAFLLALLATFIFISQKFAFTALSNNLTSGLFHTEGPILRISPKGIKVGNHTFKTQKFSTTDLRVGDLVYLDFSPGTNHVFSLGKTASTLSRPSA